MRRGEKRSLHLASASSRAHDTDECPPSPAELSDAPLLSGEAEKETDSQGPPDVSAVRAIFDIISRHAQPSATRLNLL